MKNASSLNTNNSNSPKTPGGISKSLLTPCRRIGLSRNWRRSGPSPFISPLSSASNGSEVEKECRKRKERLSEENTLEATSTIDCCDNDDINRTPIENVNVCHETKSKTLKSYKSTDITPCSDISTNSKTKTDISNTPSRNVGTPRTKKSKILLKAIDSSQEDNTLHSEQDIDSNISNINQRENVSLSDVDNSQTNIVSKIGNNENCKIKTISNKHSDSVKTNATECTLVVSKPVKSKSKGKKSLTRTNRENAVISIDKDIETKESTPTQQNVEIVYAIKDKSPNDLKKECVVVIQRKLFKNVNQNNSQINDIFKTSDTEEDEPLIKLRKQNSLKVSLDEDDDFIENQNGRKSKTTKSPKSNITSTKLVKIKENNAQQIPVSQMIHIDDDDDDFDNKRTILIRKSYEKVTKPAKAKSTGSITQRDIDNLRNRIEAKKKLLLAQSLTPDTEELRSLIKKWQRGCQDALMELLDLMRNKFPDKERMNYSEMLQTLKIPPSLVGYDSDNDCFHSPDDASIILGQFNDI